MQNNLNYNKTFWSRTKRRIKIWLNRKALINRLVTILIGLGAFCGLLTYAALTNVPPFGNSSSAVIILLNINLIILLTLVILVSRRIIALYIRKKNGAIGSKLHMRLVFIFSSLTAVPAIIMAVFSVVFFYFGLHGWLDERVRTAITESEQVAKAYLSEHQELIRADIILMATDLDRQSLILSNNEKAMSKMLNTQSYLRNFLNVYLFKPDGTIISWAGVGGGFDTSKFTPDLFQQAQSGEVLILKKGKIAITALIKLNNYIDTYAYAERNVDPKVLAHIEKTQKGVAQYQEIQKNSVKLQIILTVVYVLVTLLLTISAVWFGLSFARRLMAPITELIYAAEQASAGDLSVRVDPSYALDEFKTLGNAFNQMTTQIETQQQDLVTANTQMDFRRRFTETILGGVSTGVMSIDHNKIITLANNAAGELLHIDISDLLTQKINHIMPELSPFLEDAFNKEKLGVVQNCEINIRRPDKAIRTFMARIVIEQLDNDKTGAIVTFDDLTSVLASQKKAAWSDIARRIAHEIKNPLTPIQLSAERLNRKYRKNLDVKDQKIFDQCTETIIKHVDTIKIMVNSFADFAKMPDAIIKQDNIIPMINEVYALNKTAHESIQFNFISNIDQNKKLVLAHDDQQIRQVITNLIKNSVEALETTKHPEITLCTVVKDKYLYIGVGDNGVGLPKDVKVEKLTEPYITHKDKGSGLGLAIVKKIIEDHKGDLLFNPDLPIINDLNKVSYNTIIAISLPLDTTDI